MPYRAPVAGIAFALNHITGMRDGLQRGMFGDLDEDVISAVLDETAPAS